MADLDFTNMADFKPKSFWKKAEGKVGIVGLLAIAGGIGFLIISNITWIIGLLSVTLHAILLFAAIAAVLYLFFDKRIRTLMLYFYKSIIRWITGIFIAIDPIGILKNYLVDLHKKEKTINSQIGNLKGEIGKIQKTIKDNKDAISMSKKMAVAAQRTGHNKQVVLQVRKAGRKQNFNKNLSEVADRMSVLYNVLKKVSENVSFFIEDLEDEVSTREAEYKAIRAGHSAIKGAMGVMKGTSEEELFNQAMDYVVEETGRKIGEIEYFLDASEKFITGIDIENNMFEIEGLEMLEKWEEQSESYIIDGKTKSKIINGATAESIKTTVKKHQKSNYKEILNEWKNNN